MSKNDRASIYERVLVAAHEARRINTKQETQHVVPLRKATTEAMERVEEGAVDYELGPKSESENDSIEGANDASSVPLPDLTVDSPSASLAPDEEPSSWS